jgi:transposase
MRVKHSWAHDRSQKQIIQRLLSEPALQQRVERLMSIRGVGAITALTWALEVSDPQRFSSIGDAVSYCGLTAAFRSSAGKEQRGPISKQRNAWLQTVLIEAAKLAPRWNPQLAALHARQLELGHANRATLQVDRKLVAYLLAVDKSGQPFQILAPPPTKENATKTKTRKRASMAKAA